MIHYMNLHNRPFVAIQNGIKTIELRLYDEKRRRIAVGDTLVFTCSDDTSQTCAAVVKDLHIFPDFVALYAALPLERCGYLPEELAGLKAVIHIHTQQRFRQIADMAHRGHDLVIAA